MYTQKNKYIAPLTEIHRVKVHAVMAGSIFTPNPENNEDPDERGWEAGHEYTEMPATHNLWED